MNVQHKEKTLAALDLVRQGHTAYEAAKRAGITPGNLYKSAEYRAIIAERKAAQVPQP